jgi:hypothetical protein
MAMAVDELGELEFTIRYPFSARKAKITNTPYKMFCEFVDDTLATALSRCTKKLLANGNAARQLLEPLLPYLTSHTLTSTSTKVVHYEHAKKDEPSLQLGYCQDLAGEFLATNRRPTTGSEEFNVERYEELWDLVPQRASAVLESLKLSEAAAYSRGIGVFHNWMPDRILLRLNHDLVDCLGRSARRIWFENGFGEFDLNDLDYQLDPGEVNKQDILGRSLLHVSCHGAWDEVVEWLLVQGADPGLKTIYGSLPLHFAAARGNWGICTQLLEHAAKYDIAEKDLQGKTALHYATDRGHTKIVRSIQRHLATSPDGEHSNQVGYVSCFVLVEVQEY